MTRRALSHKVDRPLGACQTERSAQVKEEPAKRAGDTEQNALPARRLMTAVRQPA